LLCLVIVMDYGLATITVSIFLLDHGLAVMWLPLLDDSTLTVSIVIMGLANRYASANRTDANANFIGQRGRRDDRYYGGSKKRLPHFSILQFQRLGNARASSLFRENPTSANDLFCPNLWHLTRWASVPFRDAERIQEARLDLGVFVAWTFVCTYDQEAHLWASSKTKWSERPKRQLPK
jgi:hypothetical protein